MKNMNKKGDVWKIIGLIILLLIFLAAVLYILSKLNIGFDIFKTFVER